MKDSDTWTSLTSMTFADRMVKLFEDAQLTDFFEFQPTFGMIPSWCTILACGMDQAMSKDFRTWIPPDQAEAHAALLETLAIPCLFAPQSEEERIEQEADKMRQLKQKKKNKNKPKEKKSKRLKKKHQKKKTKKKAAGDEPMELDLEMDEDLGYNFDDEFDQDDDDEDDDDLEADIDVDMMDIEQLDAFEGKVTDKGTDNEEEQGNESEEDMHEPFAPEETFALAQEAHNLEKKKTAPPPSDQMEEKTAKYRDTFGYDAYPLVPLETCDRDLALFTGNMGSTRLDDMLKEIITFEDSTRDIDPENFPLVQDLVSILGEITTDQISPARLRRAIERYNLSAHAQSISAREPIEDIIRLLSQKLGDPSMVKEIREQLQQEVKSTENKLADYTHLSLHNQPQSLAGIIYIFVLY